MPSGEVLCDKYIDRGYGRLSFWHLLFFGGFSLRQLFGGFLFCDGGFSMRQLLDGYLPTKSWTKHLFLVPPRHVLQFTRFDGFHGFMLRRIVCTRIVLAVFFVFCWKLLVDHVVIELLSVPSNYVFSARGDPLRDLPFRILPGKRRLKCMRYLPGRIILWRSWAVEPQWAMPRGNLRQFGLERLLNLPRRVFFSRCGW